jgi:hypothetical protein
VKKEDANTYRTHLKGSKYKLSHKNAKSGAWSIPKEKDEREREIFLLEDAKRRIEGLPPVTTTQKIKVDRREKGQKTLDSLFSPSKKGSDGTEEQGVSEKGGSSRDELDSDSKPDLDDWEEE